LLFDVGKILVARRWLNDRIEIQNTNIEFDDKSLREFQRNQIHIEENLKLFLNTHWQQAKKYTLPTILNFDQRNEVNLRISSVWFYIKFFFEEYCSPKHRSIRISMELLDRTHSITSIFVNIKCFPSFTKFLIFSIRSSYLYTYQFWMITIFIFIYIYYSQPETETRKKPNKTK
jgi:hypothetical protein